MKPIIEIKGISKKYKIGKRQRYLNLRDQIFSFSRKKSEYFYALEDIEFDVDRGDSIALIGRNGAGKSTLLKILSRITPPTHGEIICRGRIASLLEVGTGFHSELTGKENIFLNGSILGLSKNEITSKFDEIVDFSGVEKFLDTPLKHYSSGMQLRLAFSVAAHLEPEILIIDEVLAVGDSVFQQKCINKMTSISQSGRTIIFVSHNFQAVTNLCSKAVLLDQGKCIFKGSVNETIQAYQDQYSNNFIQEMNLDGIQRNMPCCKELVFSKINFDKSIYQVGNSVTIQLTIRRNSNKTFNELVLGINFMDKFNNNVLHLSNKFDDSSRIINFQENIIYQFTIPKIPLSRGDYRISLFLSSNDEIQDFFTDAITFTIEDSNLYGIHNSDQIQGIIQTEFDFKILKE